ncbi:MAG: hypothetical protein E7180_03720 [Erysipelotrichaceae bacterium]|nr:hypothetical protein [Erysipelotrichaceae bacterium]
MKKKSLLTLSLTALMAFGVVSCGEKGPSGVEQAADYIWQLYKNESLSQKIASTDDFNVVTEVTIEDVKYNVSWAVTLGAGVANAVTLGEAKDGKQVVDVIYDPVLSNVETTYTLTATITDAKGESVVKSFERVVPAFKYSSYKDFSNPKKGQVYNVKGIITERTAFSSGSVKYLYLQNDDCGIMAYSLVCADQAAFDADLKIGNEIIVSGTVTRYNGQLEFEKGCTYSVVSKTAATLKYVDATEAFASAVNEKDVDALDPYQNRLVEVKGVTVADIYEAQNYHYFTIGTVKSYVRPSTSYGSLNSEQCEQVVAEWVQGYKANVKGILTCYSGTYYILPVSVDAVTITEKVLTDEVKVANAINDVKALIGSEIVKSTEITLPATAANEEYNTVAYTWSVVEGASAFVIEGGKLKVTVGDTPVAGKVKVVATVNGKTAEHEFDVTAKQPTAISISKFVEDKNKNDIQYLRGVVVASGGDSDYAGSFVLADETGVVFSYNKFKVNVGDEIIIATKYSEYSGLVQSATTEVVAVLSTGNDVSKYLANPVAKSIGDLSAELETCTTTVEMYEKYGQKCIQATGTVKKTDKGYAMYLNAEDNQYILNLYTNSAINEQLKTLLGSASSVELTVTGFVRGVGTANPDKGYHASLTLQLNNVVAA